MPLLESFFDWPKFVHALRCERFHLGGWSQRRLAQKLGVTVTTVSNWETGASVPQPMQRAKLQAFALRLGFPRDEWPLAIPKELKVVRKISGKASSKGADT